VGGFDPFSSLAAPAGSGGDCGGDAFAGLAAGLGGSKQPMNAARKQQQQQQQQQHWGGGGGGSLI
jgi:membrane protease subunit (stomatin/prohibitin family)